MPFGSASEKTKHENASRNSGPQGPCAIPPRHGQSQLISPVTGLNAPSEVSPSSGVSVSPGAESSSGSGFEAALSSEGSSGRNAEGSGVELEVEGGVGSASGGNVFCFAFKDEGCSIAAATHKRRTQEFAHISLVSVMSLTLFDCPIDKPNRSQ